MKLAVVLGSSNRSCGDSQAILTSFPAVECRNKGTKKKGGGNSCGCQNGDYSLDDITNFYIRAATETSMMLPSMPHKWWP